MFNFFFPVTGEASYELFGGRGLGATRDTPTRRLGVNYRTLDSLRVNLPENPYDLYVYLHLNWETSGTNYERQWSLARTESYESSPVSLRRESK